MNPLQSNLTFGDWFMILLLLWLNGWWIVSEVKKFVKSELNDGDTLK